MIASDAVRVESAAHVVTHACAVSKSILSSSAGLEVGAAAVIAASRNRRLTANAIVVSISLEVRSALADGLVVEAAANGVGAALVAAADVLALAQRVVLPVGDLGADLVLAATLVVYAGGREAAVLLVIGIAVQRGVRADALGPPVEDLAFRVARTLHVLARIDART